MTPPRVEDRWARLVPWLAALLGFLWFIALGGWRALNPTDLDWLGWGDQSQQVIGWLFFRDAPWGFPLGQTPGLMRPLTMSVGFSDSNPWMSVAFKPFSPWLPQDFQFVGLWLASCLVLQGFMGAKVMALFTPRPAQQLLGATLFILAPILVFRFGHSNLSAHWMLTALLWLTLRPRASARDAWRTLGGALLLSVFAAGTHPYLAIMTFALTLALLVSTVHPERLLGWRQAVVAFVAANLVMLGMFFLFGYMGQDVRGDAASGFGDYSADMLTLFNPFGWSRVLPWIPARPGQYEGLGFLGSGVLVLALIALAGKPSDWWPQARAQLKARWPLVVAVVLMMLFAFSTTMTAAGVTVVSMRKVTQPLMPVLNMFRASGRFIWPMHYLVLTCILGLVLWRWRRHPAVATGVLVAAVVIQVADTATLWVQDRFRTASWPRLRAPEWEHLDATYRHVVMFPPYIHGSMEPCVDNTFASDDHMRWADLAYRKGMTTNSAYSTRLNERKVATVCNALKEDVANGRLAEDTLYVVDGPRLAQFQRLGERVTCGTVEGFNVCVAASSGKFRELLLRAAAPTQTPPAVNNTP
ncbi:DUF6311 domain-containing protein [Myxococcus stipitatus]|uniref:DUF6311 domain-containing protein n=1 Tax=Myxococcus stipitatus TaxID=83455 RepID=UPI003144EE2F